MTIEDDWDEVRAVETPRFWEGYTGIRIHDPDGWRGKDAQDFSIPMTLAEFQRRAAISTVNVRGAVR